MMDFVAGGGEQRAGDKMQRVVDELNRRRITALNRSNLALVEAERARHAGVAEGLLAALSLLARLRAPLRLDADAGAVAGGPMHQNT